ncbi:lema [Trichococcus flocculiformis]|uniref:Lema n=1 Tax=Trichococcus flocculiformis TaxID=82803 RepID=A0AB38BGW1_9LACT|nr:LemA family protein [Trichococcus flocculiformis]CZQ91236.1 lema [Trichococcus flocculiformis]SFH69137.1 LemA protein [Trichococcus flocculiformis]
MEWLIGIIVVAAIIGAVWVSLYNSLVKNRLWVTEAWSQIDVQLKRRNDLIPNIVETVKGYAKYEQETLTKVINLRNLISDMGTEDPAKKMELSNQLSNQLRTVFALAEAYPDLKANQNFLALQEELSATENKIAYARQLYNSSVTQYNIKLGTFPSNIVANVHGFRPEVVLATPEEEKNVPKVSF